MGVVVGPSENLVSRTKRATRHRPESERARRTQKHLARLQAQTARKTLPEKNRAYATVYARADGKKHGPL